MEYSFFGFFITADGIFIHIHFDHCRWNIYFLMFLITADGIFYFNIFFITADGIFIFLFFYHCTWNI